MNTIQLNLEIDPANTKVAEALSNLILVIGGTDAVQKTEEVNIFAKKLAERKAVKETPKPVGQPETALASPAETTLASPAETIPSEIADKANDEAPTSAVKLQDVRDELGKKINEHRDAIKNKLTELGAKNVSSLEAIHFEAMYEFLKAL